MIKTYVDVNALMTLLRGEPPAADAKMTRFNDANPTSPR